MNRIEKGRAGLKFLSFLVMLIAIGGIVGLIYLDVFGFKNFDLPLAIVTCIGSVIGILLCLFGFVLALYFFILGKSLHATHGSIKEENLGFSNDITKCPNCGEKIDPRDTFCKKCGHNISGKNICPSCNATNTNDAEYCSSCGAKLH